MGVKALVQRAYEYVVEERRSRALALLVAIVSVLVSIYVYLRPPPATPVLSPAPASQSTITQQSTGQASPNVVGNQVEIKIQNEAAQTKSPDRK